MIWQRSAEQHRVNIPNKASRLSWDSNSICTAARRRTQLDDFDDPEIEQRLAFLIESLQEEANLHFRGRFLARMHLQGLLENRLRLVQACKNLPDLPDEPIDRPIFITGMPRSGSTFLHDLFVQNENNRAPLVWEAMFPPPAPQPDTGEVVRRVRRTDRCLWFFRQIAPAANAAHPITATSPQECVAIHSQTMLSQEFTITFNVPRYAAHLARADFTPAYRWQKRFLQFLQFGAPRKQWVLKAPDHVFSLGSLFEVFPDAIVIQMHRNPADVLRSSVNLIHELRQVFARPQTLQEVGAQETHQLAEGVEQICRFRDTHPELSDRFFDVHYRNLVSDPVETVRRLHRGIGLPWAEAHAEQIYAFASHHGRYQSPRKHVSASEGLFSPSANAGWFESYCARFGITA